MAMVLRTETSRGATGKRCVVGRSAVQRSCGRGRTCLSLEKKQVHRKKEEPAAKCERRNTPFRVRKWQIDRKCESERSLPGGRRASLAAVAVTCAMSLPGQTKGAKAEVVRVGDRKGVPALATVRSGRRARKTLMLSSKRPMSRPFAEYTGAAMAAAACSFGLGPKTKVKGGRGDARSVRAEASVPSDDSTGLHKTNGVSIVAAPLAEDVAVSAAEACEAAGRAAAFAILNSSAGENLPSEEVKICLDLALRKCSEQTKASLLEISESLMDRLGRKDQELAELRRKFVQSNDVQARIDEIRGSTDDKLSLLRADLSQAQVELRGIMQERDDLKMKVASLEEKTQSDSASKNQLLSSNESLNRKIYEMENEVAKRGSESNSRVEALQSKLQETLREKFDAESQVNLQTLRLKELEETASNNESTNKDLLDDALEKCKELSSQVELLENAKREMAAERLAIEDKLQSEMTSQDTLISSNELLSKKVSDMESEIVRLESESKSKGMDDALEKCNELSSRVKILEITEREYTSLQAKFAELSAERLVIEEKLKSEVASKETLASSNEALSSKVSDMESEIAKLGSESSSQVVALSKSNRELSETVNRMESELQSGSVTLQAKVRELEDLVKVLKPKADMHDHFLSHNEKMRRKCRQLESKVQSLKDQIKSEEADSGKLQHQGTQLEVPGLKEELFSLQSQNREMQEALDRSRDELSIVSSKLGRREEEVIELHTLLESNGEQDVSGHNEELLALQSQNRDLQQSLARSRDELSAVSSQLEQNEAIGQQHALQDPVFEQDVVGLKIRNAELEEALTQSKEALSSVCSQLEEREKEVIEQRALQDLIQEQKVKYKKQKSKTIAAVGLIEEINTLLNTLTR